MTLVLQILFIVLLLLPATGIGRRALSLMEIVKLSSILTLASNLKAAFSAAVRLPKNLELK
jgi:hypothetical protein